MNAQLRSVRGSTRQVPARWIIVLLFALGLVLPSLPQPAAAQANTLVVTTLAEYGTGSLRQAIVDAQAGDTITFAENLAGTMPLADELVIDRDLTVQGPATPGKIVLDPVANSSIVVPSGRTVALNDLTIAGRVDNLGVLTVRRALIRESVPSAGISGAGISNLGTLQLVQSAVVGNRSIAYGGGLYNSGTATVTNSTFADNQGGDGGGIHNRGTLTLLHVTVARNRAGAYGGIDNTGQLTISNSILANNTSGGGSFTDDASNLSNHDGGMVTSGGYNLSSDNTAVGRLGQPSDRNGTDPKLEAPSSNAPGVLRPLLGSPAVDNVPASNAQCPAVDQRGVSRPQGAACDSGAIEIADVAVTPPAGSPTWQAAAAPGWRPTNGPVLLADGRLLLAGGIDSSPISKRAALYDPSANQWLPLFDLPNGRAFHTTTALPDGGAILVGGAESSAFLDSRTTVRLNPVTKAWQPAAELHVGRHDHSATILANGKLLVVGGFTGGASPANPAKPIASVELYDPATNIWQEMAPLATPRGAHRAVLLPDGSVLVVGGNSGATTAERYDPQANKWTTAGTLGQAHTGLTATLLHDGRVLVVGGTGSPEVYNPATNAWSTVASPLVARRDHTATLLPTGEVLVAGGIGAEGRATAATERYDPVGNAWHADSPLTAARSGHAAVLVLGKVYLLAGSDQAEVYNAATSDDRCFAETGRCMHGSFLTYWDQHGGLAINGYPLSEPFAERLEDGKVYLVQYFERVRMEYHPENNAPFDVLLGQFGRRIHPADPAATPIPGGRYFVETGHNVPESFYTYWEAHGGLAQFGFPLTEVITETLEDGKQYEVQYFERARFERHPENNAPYDILLGQFGRRILAGR
ncbi:MAG: kelch repeat-containing protein [Chloroflexia bacterium]